MQPLWMCPKCWRGLANRNQFHFCSNLRLDEQSIGRESHVVLARRLESPRCRRIDLISPRNQVHVFRLHEPSEVDAEVERWRAEAYSVGQQHHLAKQSQGSGSES